jgi:hypothetical protein
MLALRFLNGPILKIHGLAIMNFNLTQFAIHPYQIYNRIFYTSNKSIISRVSISQVTRTMVFLTLILPSLGLNLYLYISEDGCRYDRDGEEASGESNRAMLGVWCVRERFRRRESRISSRIWYCEGVGQKSMWRIGS